MILISKTETYSFWISFIVFENEKQIIFEDELTFYSKFFFTLLAIWISCMDYEYLARFHMKVCELFVFYACT